MGPLPQERDIQWSDPLNSDLNTLAREWFGEAEARLVEIHGISDQKGYVGRSAGPKSRKVPLVALLERDHRRRFSKQTVCWISFEALLKKAKAISAGNPGAKGRALLGSWKLKLFDILEDLQLTEDGPTKLVRIAVGFHLVVLVVDAVLARDAAAHGEPAGGAAAPGRTWQVTGSPFRTERVWERSATLVAGPWKRAAVKGMAAQFGAKLVKAWEDCASQWAAAAVEVNAGRGSGARGILTVDGAVHNVQRGPAVFVKVVGLLDQAQADDRVGQLLCGAAEHREGSLHAALAVLLNGRRGLPHRIIEKGVVDAFGLNKDAVHATAPEDLASAALAGRKKLQALSFQRRRLRASDVAAALDPGLQQPDHPQWGPQAVALRDRLQERVTKALGGSTADGQETHHLVRVLQGRLGFSWDLGLRALAQAVVLSPPGCAEPPSWQDAKSRAEAMVAMEDPDAVQKAFAQDGGHTGRLLGALLAGAGPAGLPAACVPAVGAPVLPMRVQQADRAQDGRGRCAPAARRGRAGRVAHAGGAGAGARAEGWEGYHRLRRRIWQALQRQDRGRHLCAEGSPAARRLQLHPRGHLRQGPSQGQGQGREGREGRADPAAGGDGVRRDILALNGKPLVDLPLRQRREALLGAVREHAGLRFVRSSEVKPGEDAPAEVEKRVDEALSASYLADNPAEKAYSKALGLVLKTLDGPGASYWAGRCHSAWLEGASRSLRWWGPRRTGCSSSLSRRRSASTCPRRRTFTSR
ncbi:unnamed protein product [Prorocentrum cordatum]|uniref:ATP-dependent DNA ligase family profile domain-containing protein n=1 Tax=Prorocentrum cordatum TaxID=2364126 RepID=A0ABN9W0Z0_9DINO|nr:unnamed protein product [Polarella glacialis]